MKINYISIKNDIFKEQVPAWTAHKSSLEPTNVCSNEAELVKTLRTSKNIFEKEYGDKKFRVGDKVMQIKNNYDIEWTSLTDNSVGLGVFNGDIGFVGEIDHDFHTLTVIYDDKKVL